MGPPTAVEQATQWCVIGLETLCSDLAASMSCLTQGLLVSFPAPFGYSWLLPDPMPFQRSLSHSVQILPVPTARLLKKLLCQMVPDNLRLCPPPRSRLKKTGHLGQTSPRPLLKKDTSGNKHIHWDANSHWGWKTLWPHKVHVSTPQETEVVDTKATGYPVATLHLSEQGI